MRDTAPVSRIYIFHNYKFLVLFIPLNTNGGLTRFTPDRICFGLCEHVILFLIDKNDEDNRVSKEVYYRNDG